MLLNAEKTITDEKQSVTYQQIIKQAESYGDTLTHKKYGICCKHSVSSVRAVLACLYKGATVVLLSEKYGEEHNNKIIKKANLVYVINDESIASKDEGKSHQAMLSTKVTTILPNIEEKDETEDLSDVAFLLSTSGTTGIPKIAMITHQNILTNLKDIEEYFRITKEDNVLIARPLYHCAVLTGELLISLVKGLNIYFFDDGFQPAKILNMVEEKRITVMGGTPTWYYHLLSLIRKKQLPLNKVVVSGECMTKAVAEKIMKTLPDAQIYHVYGLTEASPRVSYLPPTDFKENCLSVGKPLKSVKVKLENGELLVQGENVMKGYFEDAEQTKKKLQNGWLHTGDLAEIDQSGNITILGRKDDMIIRAGMNIYPNEIKNALLSAQEFKDLQVFGKMHKIFGQIICLKVVTSLTKAEVFSLCKQYLQSYQFPDEIEIVKELTYNASGKMKS